MIPFHSPSRPATFGRPSWLEQPFVVLPELGFAPTAGGKWRIRLPFSHNGQLTVFRFIELELDLAEVPLFLDCWAASPEETIRAYWKMEPPKQGAFQPGWDDRPGAKPKEVQVTTVNAEDLGL